MFLVSASDKHSLCTKMREKKGSNDCYLFGIGRWLFGAVLNACSLAPGT